jgi:diguanylate cyclase (GGDEF)-like protein
VRGGGQTRRARPVLLSRSFAAGLIALLLAGMTWFLFALQAREQQRTAQQAESIARVVVAATVNAHLSAEPAGDVGLSEGGAADLRADVKQLRRAGGVIALGIWHLDGRPLFADNAPGTDPMLLSADDLHRAQAGRSWTAAPSNVPEGPAVRVFLLSSPTDPTGDVGTALVAVDIPRDVAQEALGGQVLWQQISLVVMVLLLIAGLLWLRQGLMRGERHARTDPLTGLPNRRALHEAARFALPRATLRRPAALLLLDLAEFKSVNDTLGHSAGDGLLTQVAAALRGRVRDGDLVVRLGGDEFAVLLTDLPDGSAAQLRAEQLLRGLRSAAFQVHDLALNVDASVGVAVAPQHGRTLEQLLQRADVAMYQAKRGHKGTMLYDEAFDDDALQRLELAAELRQALDRNEFVLHYQPKMSLPDRRIYGVEALVRWQHPTRGLLPPSDFLPLLETTGLIQALTVWVLREAARQAATWRQQGIPLKVAVNVSSRSLLSPTLAATVLSILAGADLPASFLELEVTETSIMTNPELAASILAQLRARDIDVSIDDFGAGYTSLAFLRVLPVTALKIDRSLVSRMLESEPDRAVTEALIDLGHRLGLRVIAEGVESEQLLDHLAAVGCDRAQGYVISRPLPAEAFECWLDSHLPGVGNRELVNDNSATASRWAGDSAAAGVELRRD